MLEAVRELRERVNGELERHERLGALVVTGDEWLIANGLLTPTMKIQRQAIEERYAAHGEQWLTSGEAVVALD